MSSYYDISLSSGGYVDIVFEGHTHQNYTLKDSYGVYHIQGGGENEGISHIEFAVNTANDDKRVTETEYLQSTIYRYYDADTIVDTLLKKYDKELAITKKVLGKNPSYKNSTYIGNLVAQLYYEKGVEKWGKKYDIVLGGGQINMRSPYNLQAGDVTYSMLYSLLTFDNELVLCSIKGVDLEKRFFKNSGYRIYYSSYGQGIKNNIDPNKTYYIVTDTWSSPYAPNNLTEIERLGPDVYARDLLADYILAGRLK